ncbi:MAG: transcriptional regulator, BolA protein family [uncultured archaeon A07HB70]|nr:MAG: transcriptional regulator, BolA protein family [uncultured archaeon A07HB70]
METKRVAELIEADVEGAVVADIERTPHPGEDEYDHFRAVVVASAFEDASLVGRHDLVYDALGEHMNDDIHAIDLTTFTPAEYDERQ